MTNGLIPARPVHPGEVLREEFMEPLGLSAYKVGAACHVPRTRIERVMREEMDVSPDTALRLARFLGTTPEFWLNLQANYNLAKARLAAADLEAIQPFHRAAE